MNIQDMKHALHCESSARQKAEARYAEEVKRRIAAERLVQSRRGASPSTTITRETDLDEVEFALREGLSVSDYDSGPFSLKVGERERSYEL